MKKLKKKKLKKIFFEKKNLKKKFLKEKIKKFFFIFYVEKRRWQLAAMAVSGDGS